MKKIFKSFTSFNRVERAGLVVLCSLLIILIIIRASMSLWVHPKTDSEEEKRLVTAWKKFKATQKPIVKDTVKKKNDYEDAFDENETPLTDTLDLNTVDSATLVRLKGIGPVTAGKIVARRIKKGPFTAIEQLKETGRFSASTFEILKKHLRVENR